MTEEEQKEQTKKNRAMILEFQKECDRIEKSIKYGTYFWDMGRY